MPVFLPFVEDRIVGTLPPVCMRCGAPATRTVPHNFFAKDAYSFSFKGGVRRKSYAGNVTVPVPLCHRHPLVDRPYQVFAYGFVIVVFGFILLGVLRHFVFPSLPVEWPGGALMVGWMVLTLYTQGIAIKIGALTKDGVFLRDVCDSFIKALEEREWSPEEYAAQLRINRKAAGRSSPPSWTRPEYFMPVGSVACVLILTPLGYLLNWLQSSSPPPPPPPALPQGLRPAGPWPPGQPSSPLPLPPRAWPEALRRAGPWPPGPPNLPAQPVAPATLKGLIAYWPFDEGQGDKAADQSGNGLTASIQGAHWIKGVKGSALEFDGRGARVDLGGAARLSFAAGAPFTLAGWVATLSDNGVICSFRRTSVGAPVIDLTVDGGRLKAVVRADPQESGEAGVRGGPLADGNWHHVALIRYGEGTVDLFLDGAVQGRGKGSNSAGSIITDLRALGCERYWTAWGSGVGTPYFNGSIDDFCAFNRPLTPEEVAALAGRK